jgi:S-adenosylmethionine decarboxylase
MGYRHQVTGAVRVPVFALVLRPGPGGEICPHICERLLAHSVRGMTMKALGIHLLIEFTLCNRHKIDNIDYLESVMAQAAEMAGATVLKTAFQDFNPQGVSGVVVIAESHLTIHSWPEYGYAAVDIFTCGTKVDPWKAAQFLKEELEAADMQVKYFPRGIPEATEDRRADLRVIQHAACGSSHC